MFDERIDPWIGTHQAFHIHHFLEKGILIGYAAIPPGLLEVGADMVELAIVPAGAVGPLEAQQGDVLLLGKSGEGCSRERQGENALHSTSRARCSPRRTKPVNR